MTSPASDMVIGSKERESGAAEVAKVSRKGVVGGEESMVLFMYQLGKSYDPGPTLGGSDDDGANRRRKTRMLWGRSR